MHETVDMICHVPPGAPREIGNRIALIHKLHLDKGPERVKCYVHDDCVVVLMFEGHSRTERSLEEDGEQLAVARQRVRSAASVQELMIQVVEEETRRKVVGYMSSSQQGPSLLSHVFALDPTDLFDTSQAPGAVGETSAGQD